MSFLHNVRTVAKYEAKTLRRSWFFRLFSIGVLFIFTFMNIGLFSPVGDESWDLVSIPSSVPLINLYFLNIGQALIVIFLAADFLKRDKKIDTNEVLYTRPMSNFEYVAGKTAGILRLFISLDLVILGIAMIMNIISRSMNLDIMAYLWYLLIICVPTLLFSLGLAFLLMSIIRNQAVTFLILLGIAALNMFWLWYRAGFIFDYMAFGLPLFKSGIIGFDSPLAIISQRGFFMCLGLALVFATVLLFKRLPQSKPHTIISAILMAVFLAVAAFSGFTVINTWKEVKKIRQMVIETNNRYENSHFPALTGASIDCRHYCDSIEGVAILKLKNDNNEAINKYILSLNPALNVHEVRSAGEKLNFQRENHIIDIDPGKNLSPGEIDSISISYSGTINESFCYPDQSADFRDSPYRIAMLNVNKRQAFLKEDYVLLTPETHWYPVPGLNYYPSNPARIKVDFTMFELKVSTGNELTAVSQGEMIKENGKFIYRNNLPLSGLTLAIGKYLSDTIKVDSVSYFTFYFAGNDYYKKDLSELKDTLSMLISGIMRDLETNFATRYPFNTLSLLEVPVQFFSYPKMSTQTRAEVQPSMVLLPEKLSTLQNAGFAKRFSRQKKNMIRNNQVVTDKELQVRIFNDFIRNTFISGENFRFVNGEVINEPTRYRLGPSFYFFKNNFYSAQYPVINAVFESHLQKVNDPNTGFRRMTGGMTGHDKANLILRNGSLSEILSMNPGSDTIRAVINVKGDYLFNLMRSKAGIDKFNAWFRKYLDDHRFQRVDILKFNNDLKEQSGFEIYPYLNDWFSSSGQPGFLFSNIEAGETVAGDRLKYLVSFTAHNPEPVTGIFNVAFRTGAAGRGGGMRTDAVTRGGSGGGPSMVNIQGQGMETDDISKIVLLGPDEAKKLKIILDGEPREMIINTLFAKNIPGEINKSINEIKKIRTGKSNAVDEEQIVKAPDLMMPGELIVDNEDPGFDKGIAEIPGPLKKLLKVKSSSRNEYGNINMFRAPERWQKAVQSVYYGRYILSTVYTRGGTGDRAVSWSAGIREPGYYDIYCYIGKTGDRITVRTGRGPGGPGGSPPPGPAGSSGGNFPYRDMHYKIYHDEGADEITVDFEHAEPGWNHLGRYYLSSDTAKVELSNQSSGRIVIGDAIRWGKVE